MRLELLDDQIIEPDMVKAIEMERYGLPEVGKVACLSRSEQMAQWIHCTTKPPKEGKRKNRAHNLIDLYIFTTYAPCDEAEVIAACHRTFEREHEHLWPPEVDFPDSWAEDIEAQLTELQLAVGAEAVITHAKAYINRLIQNSPESLG